jgi:hypothetical protein
MYETEEALPGEVETQVEMDGLRGRLLVHCGKDGSYHITTGLDDGRMTVDGEPFLVHVITPGIGKEHASGFVRRAYDDGHPVTDAEFDLIVEACRVAIQGITIPEYSDDEDERRMRRVRSLSWAIIEKSLTRNHLEREYERRRKEFPDVNCRAKPSYFIPTEWGPVRLVPGPNMMYATAGDGMSPHLTVSKGIFGDTRLEVKGQMRHDGDEGTSVTADMPFHIRDAKSGRQIEDTELSYRIIQSIVHETASFLRANPGINAEAWRVWNARPTVEARDELENNLEILRKAFEERRELLDELRMADAPTP